MKRTKIIRRATKLKIKSSIQMKKEKIKIKQKILKKERIYPHFLQNHWPKKVIRILKRIRNKPTIQKK
jgi:hypothetical protein